MSSFFKDLMRWIFWRCTFLSDIFIL